MDYQVSIVGGGITGALLALYLGKAGIKVCLIDKNKPSESISNPAVGRTASLNLSSIETLKEAGVWNIIQQNSKTFDEIFVWDSEGSSSVQFKATEISRNNLGAIVHNNIILEALFKEVKKISDVHLIEEESVENLTDDRDGAVIITESGLKITSEIIVGADGSLSRIRDLSKMSIRTWSYHQLAIVNYMIMEPRLENSIFIKNLQFQILTYA